MPFEAFTIQNLIWLVASFCLILPPIIFIIIRNTVKIHRQGIVKDLSAVFQVSSQEGSSAREDVIPSFEFVKYKYFLGRSGHRRDSNQTDFAWWAWAAGVTALLLVFVLFGYVISRHVDTGLLGFLRLGTSATPGQTTVDPAFRAWICGLLAALAGGYVFLIRGFFRAIGNFDFGPGSFVSAANNLIAGAILVTIFVFGLDLLTDVSKGGGLLAGAVIVIGYAVGQFPESAGQMVMERSRLAYFKRNNPEIYKNITATPIDIIDGIDSEIRDRLADHHIRSTQNLATANPLMLFVETPYGVYQIMDWVAQAQLCCAVGPDKLIRFWQLGIRTLFDLERAALNKDCRSDDFLRAIGAILLSDNETPPDVGRPSLAITLGLVTAAIQVKLDDPHVHRLRQIYIRVGERLGAANRRFSDYAMPAGHPQASPESERQTRSNGVADAYFIWIKAFRPQSSG